jgi:hypothetical protein
MYLHAPDAMRGERVRFSLLPNGRYRRVPVVAACSGEGPFTIRFAALHHREVQPWFIELTIHALASLLRASWMEARAAKAPRVSGRFSKSLPTRRLRPNQEKVRSTTQRLGQRGDPHRPGPAVRSSKRSTVCRRRRSPAPGRAISPRRRFTTSGGCR